MRNILAFVLLTLLLLTDMPLPAAAPGAEDIAVRVDTDKTALWVGEILRYTVQALHPSEVEFVTDNLTLEQFRLAPFQVRAVQLKHGTAGKNRSMLQITLSLSTVETGKGEVTVPPLHLYYFRRIPGVSRQDSAVEIVRVPAVTVGVRSTLTTQSLHPRDTKPLTSVYWQAWTALILGFLGLGFLGGRVVYWRWRRWRRPEPSASVRREERARLAKTLLNEVRKAHTAEPPALCAAVSHALRTHLKEVFGIEAPALTPAEIEAALSTAPADFRQEVRRLLEQCDQLRYGKPLATDPALGNTLLTATETLLQAPA